jgi:hypothetical protein
MPDFIPGLELSRLFFTEAVKPILDRDFPGLRYDAAVIGSGSEVLGFDTPMSRDHHWGPRVILFVSDTDHAAAAPAIDQSMRRGLPYSFRGYTTSFEEIPGEPGVLRFQEKAEGEVNHRVSVNVLREFVGDDLGYLWQAGQQIAPEDWLAFPQQKLRTLVSGAVYHEGLGELAVMRAAFAYYPHDVWLYLMACGWMRISQEEPFVGRTGDVGDEIGSRVLAGRLARDVMMLAFLIERQYTPYSKWFGTAFARLACAPRLIPLLTAALSADDWQPREAHLGKAYTVLAEMHNALGVTASLSTEVSPFHSRPYHVIHGERFSEALRDAIHDPQVKQIAQRTWIGGVDQYSDSTDLRSETGLQGRLRGLYE